MPRPRAPRGRSLARNYLRKTGVYGIRPLGVRAGLSYPRVLAPSSVSSSAPHAAADRRRRALLGALLNRHRRPCSTTSSTSVVFAFRSVERVNDTPDTNTHTHTNTILRRDSRRKKKRDFNIYALCICNIDYATSYISSAICLQKPQNTRHKYHTHTSSKTRGEMQHTKYTTTSSKNMHPREFFLVRADAGVFF